MNKAKQGYKFEKECRDLLKKEGYFIAFKSIRIRYSSIDYAGLFDIVALKGKEKRYISCKDLSKGHGYIKAHKIAISEFKNNHGIEQEIFEIWVKKKSIIKKITV